MAISVMSHGQSAALAGQRRFHAQPSSSAPVSFVRVARPKMSPARAFYRSGNCYNNWDEQAVKRMVQEMEGMAKQWRETGKVNGDFFWPGVGGGYFYGAGNHKSRSPFGPSATTSGPNSPVSSTAPSLPLDVVSTDGFYLLYADIPGLAKADLSIKLNKDRVLTVSGERKAPVEEGFRQKERVFGPFSRSWSLPDDADSEGISACVTEGVLTITVPKKQPQPEVDEAQDIAIN